jgi:choice-of-anchor A domain-containing protein
LLTISTLFSCSNNDQPSKTITTPDPDISISSIKKPQPTSIMSSKSRLTLTAFFAVVLLSAVSTASAAGTATPAQAFNLGQANGYAALLLPGGSLNMPINGGASVVGDVGASAGTHIDLGSGAKVGPLAGTDQVVMGNIYLDPNGATVKLQAQNPASVFTRDLSQAVTDAFTLNQFDAMLTPTQTLGSVDVSSNLIISGTPGLNVISLSDLKLHGDGAEIDIQGGPNDYFVFNLTGTYSQSGKSNLLLTGGITQDHILWNFIGGGSAISIGTGNNGQLAGVFLSPFRSFSITDTVLNGSIISGGDLKITSQALVVNVPEMPTTAALILGAGCLAGFLRLRRSRA